MTDLFISYSRRDLPLMQALQTALVGQGLAVWIDQTDITPSVDWWLMICQGIEAADQVVFIVSPNALASEYCMREVAYARELNKRLIPVWHQDVEEHGRLKVEIIAQIYDLPWETTARENWRYLKTLQFLDFRPPTPFETGLQRLIETLQTDVEYIREHTRLLERALRWQKSGEKAEYLIRGDDLFAAEQWLMQSGQKSPAPTDNQRAFIAASIRERERQAAKAAEERMRLRYLWQARFGLVLAIALVAMLGLLLGATQSTRTDALVRDAEQRQHQAETRAADYEATLRYYETVVPRGASSE